MASSSRRMSTAALLDDGLARRQPHHGVDCASSPLLLTGVEDIYARLELVYSSLATEERC